MSLERDPDRDQVLPTIHEEGEGYPSAHDLACDMLQDRKAHGTRKYGTPLQPANGRSFLLDATEEAADLMAYLRGKLWEEDNPDRTWVGEFLWSCITGGGHWGEFEKIPGIPPQVAQLATEMLASYEAGQDDVQGPQ